MTSRVAVGILAGALAAAGCGRATWTRDAPPRATACRAPGAPRLTPEAIDADLEVLRRTLRRGYAGYRRAGSEATWDRVFADLHAAAHALGPEASGARLRDLLTTHLRFLEDNHVGFWTYEEGQRRWRGVGGHHQAYLADARFTDRDGDYWSEDRRLIECDGRAAAAVLAPVLGPDAQIERRPLVLSRQPQRALRCRFEADGQREERSLPLHPIGIDDGGGPPFARRDAPFPWLRVRTLAMTESRRLAAFVATADQVRAAPVVVLDLRGAGGGSDRFLLRFFEGLTDRELRYWRRSRLRSEVVARGALDFWSCVRAARRGDVDPWVDERIAQARREVARARRPYFALEPRQTVVRGRAPAPFGGTLVLVVDRGCQSACETAVLLARQLPRAIVVGENTGGVMEVGEIRRYRLPHSRVYFTLGSQVHDDPTGSLRESYGFLPDLWLDGGDPDSDIRALVACLGRGGCSPPPR